MCRSGELEEEQESMGQPRRPMGGRCTTQTDWKDDQQGNLKEVWLDLLFLTPTEGTGGKLSIAPRHLHFPYLGTTSSSEALASDKNVMNHRETSDASPLRPMGHHRRWRLTPSILQSQLDQLPSFHCVQSSSFYYVRGGKRDWVRNEPEALKLKYTSNPESSSCVIESAQDVNLEFKRAKWKAVILLYFWIWRQLH